MVLVADKMTDALVVDAALLAEPCMENVALVGTDNMDAVESAFLIVAERVVEVVQHMGDACTDWRLLVAGTFD